MLVWLKILCAFDATDRCGKGEIAAVDGDIVTLPITPSPTHIQLVAAALCDEVVDPQSDVVTHGHNKKALVVQSVGVLSAVADRIGVSCISRTKSPTSTSIGSFTTSATW